MVLMDTSVSDNGAPGGSAGVDPEQAELLDRLVEVVLPIALHQPELCEAPDHGAECVGRNDRVDPGVRPPLLLEPSTGPLRSFGKVPSGGHPHGVDLIVVARHLLDHTHDGGLFAIALQVATVGLP